jgi:hypothetical protein
MPFLGVRAGGGQSASALFFANKYESIVYTTSTLKLPKHGDTLATLCHTFVFSNPPDAKTFRVVEVKGLRGSGKIVESGGYMGTGDVFNGPLELGPAHHTR